jgi:transcriptional regulator with AAA-type ATPase domain
MSYSIPEFRASIVDEGFTPEDVETRELYKEVEAFAKQGQPIVIFGPTGAGKEFLARHYYNTLIKAEFYQQYRENWQLKFNEIRKQYSAFYSGQSLDIFLNSIKAGIFQSINAATIYPNLAESILFGHEANSFTGALTSPGLLESIKYGVLFLDEIGELPKDLQAKLLRAVDSEIYEGRRISGKMDYSLKDVIIISATNQPRDRIRDDFYYKMGVEVNIKGIDGRPKDLRKSIPYFIGKAIGKRKDYAAVIHMFGIKGLQNINKLSETGEVKNFAQEMAGLMTDEILIRKWPGNFRSVRRALEAAIFRIESPENINAFTQEFRKNLRHYVAQYSEDRVKTTFVAEKSSGDIIYPSRYPDKDTRILEKIYKIKDFQEMDDFEKKVLAVFLSSTHETGFRRKDLEDYYKKHDSIKHTSEAHIRNKINKLLTLKVLDRKGNSKSTRYHLTKSFLEQINIEIRDIFILPDININWTDRTAEIDSLSKVLLATDRIYIQAPSRYGKSAFIAMFCKTLEKQYNFYYYPLGEAGVKKMLEEIIKLMKLKDIGLDADKIREDAVNNLHPFLDRIFRTKEDSKPVLILDNAHYISDPSGIKVIMDLAKKWQEVTLILIGDIMDNAFLEDFHEFPLGPWGKQA